MDILMLKPTLMEKIWGGKKLHDNFGFEMTGDNIGEAWLLSCHKDGLSYAEGGKYDGLTLAEIIDKEGKDVLGTHCKNIEDFPVLVKLIDATDKLSVQVHPGDEYARRVENENGKTEAWYILEAEEGAQLVYGVNREMSREEFATAVRSGHTDDVLNFVNVKAGDVVFIPSGTLHAIGEGILLAEVQQSSNTTYRAYDYNRLDKNGELRPLHVDKCIDVVELTRPMADFSPVGKTVVLDGAEKTKLTGCEYFSMTLLETKGDFCDKADENSFVSFIVLDGTGKIQGNCTELSLKKGASVFVPAGFGEYTLSGNMKLLETRV